MSKPSASASPTHASSSSATPADDIAALPASLSELQALHVKLTKKIAQLTKVIVLLNTKNDEHAYQLTCIQQQHGRELAQQQGDLTQQFDAALAHVRSLHGDELAARDKAIQALQTELVDEKRALQAQWREREASVVERVRDERAKEELELRRLREEMDGVRLTLTSKLHHFNKTIRDLDAAHSAGLTAEQQKREQEVQRAMLASEERIRQMQRQLLESEEEKATWQRKASDQTVALQGEERARAEVAEVRRTYEARLKERERDAVELEKKWMSELQAKRDVEDRLRSLTAQWDKEREDRDATHKLGAHQSGLAVQAKEEECGRLQAEVQALKAELSSERGERERSDGEREKGRMKNAEGEAERRRLAAEAKEERERLAAEMAELNRTAKEKEARWADEQRKRAEQDNEAAEERSKSAAEKQSAEVRLSELEAKLTAAEAALKEEDRRRRKQEKEASDSDEQRRKQQAEWTAERQRLADQAKAAKDELNRVTLQGREKEEAEFADVERRMSDMREAEKERMRETRELRERYEEEQRELEEKDRARQQQLADERAQWEQRERELSEANALLTASVQHAGVEGDKLDDELQTLRRSMEQADSDKARLTVEAADRQRQHQQALQQAAERELALTASLDSLRRDMQAELQRRQQLEAQLTHSQSSSHSTAQQLQTELSKLQAAFGDTQRLLKAAEESGAATKQQASAEQAAWQMRLAALEEQLAHAKVDGDVALRQQGEALESKLAQLREQLDKAKAIMAREREDESERWKAKLAASEATLQQLQQQHEQLLAAEKQTVAQQLANQQQERQTAEQSLQQQHQLAIAQLNAQHAALQQQLQQQLDQAATSAQSLRTQLTTQLSALADEKQRSEAAQASLAVAQKQLATAQRESQQAVQLAQQQHALALQQLAQQHSALLDAQSAQHSAAISALNVQHEAEQREWSDAKQRMQQRWERREARREDVLRIRELEEYGANEKRKRKQVEEERRVFQLELINREENFNKVFGRSPVVATTAGSALGGEQLSGGKGRAVPGGQLAALSVLASPSSTSASRREKGAGSPSVSAHVLPSVHNGRGWRAGEEEKEGYTNRSGSGGSVSVSSVSSSGQTTPHDRTVPTLIGRRKHNAFE